MTAMKHSTVVTAPFSGNIVPLNKVPDETFASGVLGEGIAIEPSDGLFCSPVNGTVETIAGTKHAIGFVADGGLEIMWVWKQSVLMARALRFWLKRVTKSEKVSL